MTETSNSKSENIEEKVRLSKRMSELGLCSRREADDWIAKGWVAVNGRVVNELGIKVNPNDKIGILPEAKREQNQRVTVILNKPLGYVSGQAEDGYEPAKVLITPANHWSGDHSSIEFDSRQLKSLVPAGRLDINSTGLLILTQDGRIAKALVGENSSLEKEYLVRVELTDGRPLSDLDNSKLELLRYGLELDGKKLIPAKIEKINENQLKFVLKEGRNRQIRRMCEQVGLKVLQLKRVRIGNIRLANLPIGKWRYFDPASESFTESRSPQKYKKPMRKGGHR
ncbi:MAG: rRNA pseudouridine synthase [Burkholderiales bacterium]|nr:rRNA pseudouridine synthase [Burkholderiales bacterium]